MKKEPVRKSGQVYAKWDDKKLKLVVVKSVSQADLDRNLIYEFSKSDWETFYVFKKDKI